MNRRAFLSLAPAALALPSPGYPELRQLRAVLVATVPSFLEAVDRGVGRAWDNLPRWIGVVHVQSWSLDDSQIAPRETSLPVAWALVIERDGQGAASGQFIDRSLQGIPNVVRVVTVDPLTYSQTRGNVIPASIVLSGQRRGAETVIRVPRVWEAQIFRQFSRAPAQADGSRTLEDFEKTGMPMSEIFWRQDELVADLVGGLLPKIVNDFVLEDAVARIECRQVEEFLTETRVEVIV